MSGHEKDMKKKHILSLVALLTVIGLTACGGEASSVSSTSDSSSQTSSVEPSTEDSSEISTSDEVSSEDSSEDSSSEDSSSEDSSSSSSEDSSSEDSSTDDSSSSSSDDSSSVEEIPVEGVSLDQTYAYAEIGGTVTLTATVTPENTTDNYSVEWSSSDESVATVVDGVVTGVTAGTTTITATVGTYSTTCTVYVKTAVTSIAAINAANPSSGDYYRIQGYVYSSGGTSAYVYDGTASILVYNWNNSNAVNDSALTGGNFVQGSYVDIYGKISLYTTYNNLIELLDDDTDATYAHTYTPTSEITAPSAGTVTEANQLASMVYNEVYTVTAQLDSGSGRYWIFNVDGEKIEYVLNSNDPNNSTALAAFQALTVGNIYNITAPSYGYSSTYGYCFQAFGDYVSIEALGSVTPTSITVATESDTIAVGSTTTVSVETYSPWYADASGVAWSSSDDSIATVSSDGTVTGVAAGSVTITGTIGDASASVTITVSADPVSPESITVTIDNASIAIGGTATATAVVSPAAADQSVTWSSSDTNIATIDENGLITGVAVGTATITATSTVEGTSVSGNATINVCNWVSYAYDFSSLTENGTSLTADTALTLFNKTYTGNDSSPISSVTDISSVYSGNGSGGAFSSVKTLLKFGTSSANGSMTLNFATGTNISQVIISAHSWNTTSATSMAINGISQNASVSGTAEELTYTLSDATDTITFASSGRVTIHGITFIGEASEDGESGETGGETEGGVTYDIPENATAISTATEFNAFFDGAATNYMSNAYLAADIDLTETELSGLRMAGDYSGIFEGCGHTITYSSADATLFNIVSGTVRNVNVVVTGWTNSGFGVVAYANNGGTFDNVDVEVTISASINSFGPVAFYSTGTISNCDSTIHMTADAASSNTLYGAARADDGSTFTNNTYHVDGEGYNASAFTDVEGVTWRA